MSSVQEIKLKLQEKREQYTKIKGRLEAALEDLEVRGYDLESAKAHIEELEAQLPQIEGRIEVAYRDLKERFDAVS